MSWQWLPLASIVALVGCSDESGLNPIGDESGPEPTAQPEEIPAPFTPERDVEYIDAIVPHHRMAIRMADEVISRGANPDVRAMAEKMKSDQAAEIKLLEAQRAELTDEPSIDMEDDEHMDSDLSELQSLSGSALDVAFLEHMIPHHAGGLQLAHRALPFLEDPEVLANATMVEELQSREIGDMRAMLDAMGQSATPP